jgi:hypothetical protein
MNVFFDVDYTILGWDWTLRPHTRSVFEQLIADGHVVYVWSGVGIRTADLEKHALIDLVAGVYQKPLDDFDAGLEKYGIPVVPDFVIDDYPEIVEHFGGLHITPYWNQLYANDDLMQVPPMVAERAEHKSPPVEERRD